MINTKIANVKNFLKKSNEILKRANTVGHIIHKQFYFAVHRVTYNKNIVQAVSLHHRRNMSNIFKFTNYDCIGFDLDNCLLRYNLTNMAILEYNIIAKFLVEQKGYDPRNIMKPLTEKDIDFVQKGLFLDFEKGNILRIRPDGLITKACHGSQLLSASEINNIYPGKRWDVTDIFSNDMLATWNGPLSMKMRALLDYFDLPVPVIFARIIDTLDENHGKPLGTYNVWPDILDAMTYMFDRNHFAADKGEYFTSLKNNPEKYIQKCNSKVISWIKQLKKQSVTFLITGSAADFMDFTASYAFGEDWKSLFDIIICYAKKPGFFTSNRPFLNVVNHKETDIVLSEDLKQNGIYSQGNWNDLKKFLTRISKKDEPQCLYIGDNLLQDVYVPNVYIKCDTVAIIEEQLSEGMEHQTETHPDKEILNSKFWGSYFCLVESECKTDSFWGYVIRNNVKICIPSVDSVACISPEEPLNSFDGKTGKFNGYYPAIPTSLSTLE